MLLLFLASCVQATQHQSQAPTSTTSKSVKFKQAQCKLDSCKQFLHNGDIVLRTGNDVISSMFAQLNLHDKTFSHCGIAFKENHEWFVYHSIGGEDNPDEKLKRDRLEQFTSPENNFGFGICHYNLNDTQRIKLQQNVYEFYAEKIPFDMQFSLESSDRFYCAEMVYRAFNKTFNTDTFFTTTNYKGFHYVSTDNLFVNNKALILCHVIY